MVVAATLVAAGESGVGGVVVAVDPGEGVRDRDFLGLPG